MVRSKPGQAQVVVSKEALASAKIGASFSLIQVADILWPDNPWSQWVKDQEVKNAPVRPFDRGFLGRLAQQTKTAWKMRHSGTPGDLGKHVELRQFIEALEQLAGGVWMTDLGAEPLAKPQSGLDRWLGRDPGQAEGMPPNQNPIETYRVYKVGDGQREDMDNVWSSPDPVAYWVDRQQKKDIFGGGDYGPDGEYDKQHHRNLDWYAQMQQRARQSTGGAYDLAPPPRAR